VGRGQRVGIVGCKGERVGVVVYEGMGESMYVY
jgi:hypothetical protein